MEFLREYLFFRGKHSFFAGNKNIEIFWIVRQCFDLIYITVIYIMDIADIG